MASERSAAKASIKQGSADDKDLSDALADASTFRIEQQKEENRHKETIAAGERGWLGRLLGGERNAPTTVAFLATVSGLGIACWCLALSAQEGADSAFWSQQADRAFAFAGTSLGFIFGRGMK